MKDIERPGQPEKFVDAGLIALLDKDSGQTLEALNVDTTTIEKSVHKVDLFRKKEFECSLN